MIKEKYKANTVFHHDYRIGSTSDQSSNGIDGTFTGAPIWKDSDRGRYLWFDGTNDLIDCGNNGDLGTDDFTIMIRGKFDETGTDQYFLSKYQDSDNRWYIRRSAAGEILMYGKENGNQRFNISCNQSLIAGVWYDIILVGDRGTSGYCYINGVNDTNLSQADTDDMDNTGNYEIARYDAAEALINIMEILQLNVALSPTEVAELYTELRQEAHLNSIPQTIGLPQLAAYNEFEKDSHWTKGTGWTISNGKASSDGSQTANSDLTQNIGVIGNLYTIEYSISGYSAGNITALAGTAEGTDRSANGVYTEGVTAAGSGLLGMRADLDFVGNIDWIKISQGSKIIYYANGKDWNESTGNVTTGGLENTGWIIPTSGTWQIDNSLQKLNSGNVVVNGIFDTDTIWSKGSGWTIASGVATCDGVSASSYLSQAGILTIGKWYEINYDITAYTSGDIRALIGAGGATSLQNAIGTYTFIVQCASDTTLYLQSQNFNGSIDNVIVREIISSGGKQITNIASGNSFLPMLQAYGTWEWDFYKGADGNTWRYKFISNNALALSSNFNGYAIEISATEELALRKRTAGALSDLFRTTTGYITNGQWYRIKITRTAAGVFTVFISVDKGNTWTTVDPSGGSGTNPITDTTHTTSAYNVLEIDTDDAIRNFKFSPI